MNLQRLYAYRFRDVDQGQRETVWREIARHVHGELGHAQCVLDPAAGRCEFINAVAARERWAVDVSDHAERSADPGVHVLISDVMAADLPEEHFDGIFVSNFLEHLPNPDAVSAFLTRMRESLRPGGRIAVMGPNFRYCAESYFDFADHTLALTHVAAAEHLYAAGFDVRKVLPRFLPLSFRGRLPASASLARLYLRLPLAWKLLGQQFLVVGIKAST